MKMTATACVLAVLLAATAAGLAAEEGTEEKRPCIEVMFVLDTTGSMSGLIEGAKRKIWSIANSIATGKPSPDVRMGLVGYRDRGDQYVTRVTPLTDDLDAVFKVLTGFCAEGGGDTPEHVNQALRDAVDKALWSAPESEALKIIFLVGDAPPHTDYPGDVQYQKTLQEALKRNIMVNTIQCGGHGECRRHWQEIARLGEGRYVAIEQSGGMAAVATPFDTKLAELERKLAGTYLYYGSASERKLMAEKERCEEEARDAAAEIAPGAAADRASVMALRKAREISRADLVDAVFAKKVDLEKLADELLPKELRGKTLEEKKAIIEAMRADRQAIQAEIGTLAAKRKSFLEEDAKKRGGRDGFDEKVKDIIREKARKAGIDYD